LPVAAETSSNERNTQYAEIRLDERYPARQRQKRSNLGQLPMQDRNKRRRYHAVTSSSQKDLGAAEQIKDHVLSTPSKSRIWPRTMGRNVHRNVSFPWLLNSRGPPDDKYKQLDSAACVPRSSQGEGLLTTVVSKPTTDDRRFDTSTCGPPLINDKASSKSRARQKASNSTSPQDRSTLAPNSGLPNINRRHKGNPEFDHLFQPSSISSWPLRTFLAASSRLLQVRLS
jgi:hypothetical protein